MLEGFRGFGGVSSPPSPFWSPCSSYKQKHLPEARAPKLCASTPEEYPSRPGQNMIRSFAFTTQGKLHSKDI